jgi:hypothetical protein
VGLIGFEWVGSYAYDFMDGIHRFPVEMVKLTPKLRLGWLYMDIFVSGAVLIGGVGRFIRDAFSEE